MTEYGVLVEDNAYRVYSTENGVDKRPFGPRFAGPRLAGQYADLSAGRPISPLRTSRWATEVETETPRSAREEPLSSFSRPDAAATSQSVRASG